MKRTTSTAIFGMKKANLVVLLSKAQFQPAGVVTGIKVTKHLFGEISDLVISVIYLKQQIHSQKNQQLLG